MWDILKKDEDLPEHAVSRWALQHPFLLALVSSVAGSSWTWYVLHDWRAVGGVAIGMIVLQLLLWLPTWGPARRQTERVCGISKDTD